MCVFICYRNANIRIKLIEMNTKWGVGVQTGVIYCSRRWERATWWHNPKVMSSCFCCCFTSHMHFVFVSCHDQEMWEFSRHLTHILCFGLPLSLLWYMFKCVSIQAFLCSNWHVKHPQVILFELTGMRPWLALLWAPVFNTRRLLWTQVCYICVHLQQPDGG